MVRTCSLHHYLEPDSSCECNCDDEDRLVPAFLALLAVKPQSREDLFKTAGVRREVEAQNLIGKLIHCRAITINDDGVLYVGVNGAKMYFEQTGEPLAAPQPPPTKNSCPAVWDLVVRDMRARDAVGEKRYGTRLQPNNGRNSLRDLYEELLDAVVYCRQRIYEEEGY